MERYEYKQYIFNMFVVTKEEAMEYIRNQKYRKYEENVSLSDIENVYDASLDKDSGVKMTSAKWGNEYDYRSYPPSFTKDKKNDAVTYADYHSVSFNVDDIDNGVIVMTDNVMDDSPYHFQSIYELYGKKAKIVRCTFEFKITDKTIIDDIIRRYIIPQIRRQIADKATDMFFKAELDRALEFANGHRETLMKPSY